MSALCDILGKVSGRLTVLSRLANNKNGRARWRCLCNCGNMISVTGKEFRAGHVKSCGCLQRDWATTGQRKEGVAFRQIYTNYKCRAYNHKIKFSLSREEFYELTQKPCAYCNRSLTNSYRERVEVFRYNGIDRIDSCRGYVSGNVVPCCQICNTMKMGLPLKVFLAHLKLVFDHLRIK